MKAFKEWYEENYGEKMPTGNIPMTWFNERNLPVVVKCTCCEMTMALPSAFIDDEQYIYCSSCSESLGGAK